MKRPALLPATVPNRLPARSVRLTCPPVDTTSRRSASTPLLPVNWVMSPEARSRIRDPVEFSDASVFLAFNGPSPSEPVVDTSSTTGSLAAVPFTDSPSR